MQAAVAHVSPFSGTWYPDDPTELGELLASMFENSLRRTGPYLAPNAAGFVVPHAGLIYSGTVAAAAYRHLQASRPKRVILLGFAHRGAASGVWIPEISAYRTPLGELAVDCETVKALLDGGEFRAQPESVLCDHSVEIQLPVVQHACPDTKIVPVYVSHLEPAARSAAARRLATLAGPGSVFVASSDLTHFGRNFGFQPFPVNEWVGERLRDLDNSVIEAAGSLSAGLFLTTLRTSGSTVCGYDPIALLLETMRSVEGDEIFQETLDYQTSGEITGDFGHSVSYGALGYFPASSFRLEAEDQALLISSARATLARFLKTGERKPVPPERITPGLERRAGAFVTMHQRGELRGCVGRKASVEPLWEAVPGLALAAALDDSRFDPVGRGEQGLEVEISLLSPFKRISDPRSFRVNEHGAMIETGLKHGLLLPQVATERGWSADQFLDALTRKAGVSRDAYRDPSAHLYVFRAQIIQ